MEAVQGGRMRSGCLLIAFWFTAFSVTDPAASPASRQVVLPAHASVSELAQLAHHGRVGLVTFGALDGHTHLVSFTVSKAEITDELVLDDFPSPAPGRPTVFSMAVNENGLVAVYGNGANNSHVVVAVSADADGKLTKKWAVSYPNPSDSRPEATTNADGSIVYIFYNDASPKADKIRAEDGAVLGTVQLDDVDIEAGLTFNPVSKRLIVKSGLANLFHVFKPEPDFAVDWSMRAPLEFTPMRRGFVSADGRFLIGYGGYQFAGNEPLGPANNFLTVDLESREFHILRSEGKLAPSGVSLTFAPSLATLIVPYSSTIRVHKNGGSACVCGTQVVDWLSLGSDGALTRQFTTKLPGDQEIIGPLNNAALSKTSAIAFLATDTKRLVAVDTLSGEVVSDQEVGDVFFIYRIGNTDTFLTTNGTNVLKLLDLNAGPLIRGVTIKKRRLIIEGENFLAGARVQINGQDTGTATRTADNPGHEIILDRGKKDFPEGQDLTVEVINRDGLRSKPFTVAR
jgi:hypothetical protein